MPFSLTAETDLLQIVAESTFFNTNQQGRHFCPNHHYKGIIQPSAPGLESSSICRNELLTVDHSNVNNSPHSPSKCFQVQMAGQWKVDLGFVNFVKIWNSPQWLQRTNINNKQTSSKRLNLCFVGFTWCLSTFTTCSSDSVSTENMSETGKGW